MKYLAAACWFLMVLLTVFSCEPKEEILTTKPDAILQFSADSVQFDTVFTQTGSVTKRLWVYNFNKNAVQIEEIRLGRGIESPFRLVVDGQETPVARDLRIRGRDSLFVLVKVFIEPNNTNTPFLVQDALSFRVNNNVQAVPLVAYGQNAYFHRNETLACNTVWTADKPHVLFGEVQVGAGCRLTIEKGARIYAHDGAQLAVAGTLHVTGTVREPVLFDGDRLEPFYDDIPGQWNGIRFLPGSRGNVIRYAEIRNADVGLLADNADQDPATYDLVLEQSILRNMYTAGIFSLSADVQAVNTLITNCGQYAVVGLGGGTYDFTYCTIANFTPEFNRTTPSFAFSDRLRLPNGQVRDYRIKVSMINSIVWAGKRSGKLTEEMLFQTEAGTRLDTTLTYNILQTERYSKTLNKTNKFNQDPKFKSAPDRLRPAYPFNYALDTLSAANGAARPLPHVTKDILDLPRDPVKPDIGAYERLRP